MCQSVYLAISFYFNVNTLALVLRMIRPPYKDIRYIAITFLSQLKCIQSIAECLKDPKYEVEIFLTHKYQEGSNQDTDPEYAED